MPAGDGFAKGLKVTPTYAPRAGPRDMCGIDMALPLLYDIKIDSVLQTLTVC